MLSYAVPFLLTLAACFSIQALGLRAVGGRTSKSESNYFSSIGRIQAGTLGDPEVMLLGSSVTGRLPDRSQGFEGFANMGCDGGTAIDVLRRMDQGILPAAPCLVIEANYLHRALDPKPSEIYNAMQGAWFQAGTWIPGFSAYARPSSFFYSLLLAKKIGGFADPAADDDLQVTSAPARPDTASALPLSIDERELIDELVPLLHRLQKKRCRIVFVWLPPGRGTGVAVSAWLLELVAKSGSEWWDLGNEAEPKLVELTDGVHMGAPSAARTVRSLRKGLDH